MKTKTKKSKICQERRELNPLKTFEGSEGRNMDILLNIANSMKLLADRHSEQRFKAIDVKVIELIVTELTLTRRMDEYERDQNRAKVREMKSLIQKVVAKKNEVIAESERINLLIRSGSPKNRKGIIAYEMSPPMFNHPVGLIQRKIEEDNRERVTFEAMKKRDQRFGRLFDFVDRMAEKLNVGSDENGSLKGRISKITQLVQGFASNEEEYKKKIKEESQCNTKLKQEVQALTSQNTQLKASIDRLTAELESSKQQAALTSKLYSELQQDFNLLAKEKLDSQTTFSKVLSQSQRTKDKYSRTINSLKIKFSELLKEEVDELKNTQLMLSKQVEEFTLSHCESVNTIIYHYTKEMIAMTTKKTELKKQLTELQLEKSGKQEERGTDLERLRMEVRENAERESMKRERLAVVQCYYEEFQGEKTGNNGRLAFESLDAFTYSPATKIDECSPTYMKNYHLILSQVVGLTIQPKTQSINLENKVFELVLGPSCKTYLQLETQTEPQTFTYYQSTTIDTHQFSLQTTLEHSTQEIQAIPQFNNASTDTFPYNLAICPVFSLVTAHPQTKANAFTEIEHASLNLNEGFSIAIFPTKTPKLEADTNTDLPSTSFSQPQPSFQPQTPTKKPIQPSNDPFLSFLLQAQQCTILPEISILREQLRLHRLQIDSLRSQLASRPKQAEEPSVFQFHY